MNKIFSVIVTVSVLALVCKSSAEENVGNRGNFGLSNLFSKLINGRSKHTVDYDADILEDAGEQFIPFVARAVEPSPRPGCICKKLTLRMGKNNVQTYEGLVKATSSVPVTLQATVESTSKIVITAKVDSPNRFSSISTKFFFERVSITNKNQLGSESSFSFEENKTSFSTVVNLNGEVCLPEQLPTTFGIWANICSPVVEKDGSVTENCYNEILGRETFRLRCV